MNELVKAHNCTVDLVWITVPWLHRINFNLESKWKSTQKPMCISLSQMPCCNEDFFFPLSISLKTNKRTNDTKNSWTMKSKGRKRKKRRISIEWICLRWNFLVHLNFISMVRCSNGYQMKHIEMWPAFNLVATSAQRNTHTHTHAHMIFVYGFEVDERQAFIDISFQINGLSPFGKQ